MHKQRVLITGGGSGLGRALALRYARAGWRAGLADISLERAESVAAEIRALGGEADSFSVDVASDEAVLALRDEVMARWGGLEHLYNNAGVSSAGNLLQTPMTDWRWMLEINLLSVVRGCQAFLPEMLRQGSGHVVNTASFAGLAGAGGLSSYSVAKAAVVTLSETLRAELALADSRVGVSVVCPSFFRTNLLQNFRGPDASRQMAQKLMENAAENADDIAAAIFDAVMAGRFLIVPTALERMRYRLKRWLPEFYFGRLVAALKAAGRSA
ncbi:NADP-dependent 3-hydroxy acid dehydrogenase YdfG [Tahibacter aquaticus]|uniref:NADP-dependent 3-hydroxy acid dehydrogenase YdfG n=1 Tax=Tahibacter aquaticus TaxID=520092 RepID=A0A4R6Z7L8_9GAMM|nr:SDR family NAD(P)-dependent oxidoreductase [Tahibacter aquaticus]TDR47818.1 NADP-dependent 3-hydroxy acid dehydrogenase YdfG [Tahibacter aquaticus]